MKIETAMVGWEGRFNGPLNSPAFLKHQHNYQR